MSHEFGRALRRGLLATVLSLLPACAIPSPYVAPTQPGTSASLVIRSAPFRPEDSWTGHLDIYDFSAGCPEINVRMRSSGYRGSVEISQGAPATIALPTGSRLVLKSSWRRTNLLGTSYCNAVVSIIPLNGARYIYEYQGPAGDDQACDSRIGQIVVSADGSTQSTAVASAAYPRLTHGMSGVEAPGLCERAQREAAAEPSPRQSPVTGDRSAVSAADDPPPHVAATPQFAPVLPGTGLRLALGFAAGGDNLLTATFANGSSQTLSAGQGWFGAIGATVTPIWIGNSAGFGFGADIGWKVDSVDAMNASVQLSRFPLTGWVQTLLGADQWWFLGAVGVQKELSAEVSGDGDASSLNQSFETPLAWIAELGLYYRESRHAGVGGFIRYTSARYRAGSTTIDASNVGFALTMHFRP